MKLIRNIMFLAALLIGAVSYAQPGLAEKINWKSSVVEKEDGVYQVLFTGRIAAGYYTYTLDDQYSATSINDLTITGGELVGVPYEVSEPKVEADGTKHFYGSIVIAQDVKPTEEEANVSGVIFANICSDTTCSAEYFDFNVKVGEKSVVATPVAEAEVKETPKSGAEETEGKALWALVIEAILWGFAMLLTPCVFPMVPMTVSFFMKGSENQAAGRFKAAMYGLFIVLLYTVPISVIIMLTRWIGGDAVTADIFNWLSTHWIPNIIFFVVFMIFAASFFGAFEITMPQSLVNKSDQGSDKKGLAGVFFMALTLVLVSFSCTGPIVGTVLIESTQGKFWAPMVTMLAFSGAFALPFTILAFFPSLLKKFKKSGGSWLNSVKVVLGFIEIALGLKFLSVADQTYHWGLLDREVYLAIWIAVFTLLGLYLLGKIRFEADEPVEHLSVPRLTLAIAVFSFVVYLVPGMFGAPLSGISGYLPPLTSQEFVIGQQAPATNNDNCSVCEKLEESSFGQKYDLHLPLGLSGYFKLEEGLEAAKIAGKPVFVDVTGHGCVNCREMESRVWSDPRVLEMLKNDYIIVALYTDDKTKLAEEDQITDAQNGKVYKDLGRANSYIARTLWDVNAQPNYVLLSPEGEVLVPVRGYDLSVEGFINFLQSGLDTYNN
jgi:thiol:disulfide interchange protein DsbD